MAATLVSNEPATGEILWSGEPGDAAAEVAIARAGWAEWAALSPFFRVHGSLLAGTHTPWSYDQETVDHYNAFTRLHLAAR